MIEFLDCIAFVALLGTAIGILFIIMWGIFELINFLTKGKLIDLILKSFPEEESDE